ncbi:MAG: hypothetical protein KA210_09485 [Bacteroidia bacterium]|jgi:hypothetical protein|nr:hypothetical protein [Bacteroidia bacterium]
MSALMVTMTDVFYAIGDFSQTVFRGMKVLGFIPSIILWVIIGALLAYWTVQIMKQTKEADKNGTLR